MTSGGFTWLPPICSNWSYWCKSLCNGRKGRPLRVNLTAIFSSSLEWESKSLQQITSSGLKIKQTTAGWLIQWHSISHPPEFSKQDVFISSKVSIQMHLSLLSSKEWTFLLLLSLVRPGEGAAWWRINKKLQPCESGLMQWVQFPGIIKTRNGLAVLLYFTLISFINQHTSSKHRHWKK